MPPIPPRPALILRQTTASTLPEPPGHFPTILNLIIRSIISLLHFAIVSGDILRDTPSDMSLGVDTGLVLVDVEGWMGFVGWFSFQRLFSSLSFCCCLFCLFCFFVYAERCAGVLGYFACVWGWGAWLIVIYCLVSFLSYCLVSFILADQRGG